MVYGKYLLIAVILLISFINCKETERGIQAETVALEIYFKGPCSRVNKVINTIRVSSHRECDKCLPISLSPGNPDNNDLNSHILCTDMGVGGHISLVRIVEVFSGTDDTVEVPADSFILSIESEVPFKVKGNVTYMAKPLCLINEDFCTTTTIVGRCIERILHENEDFDIDGFYDNAVVERIYILQPGQDIQSCNSSTTCCPYVSTDTSTSICKLQQRVDGRLGSQTDFSDSIPIEHHHFEHEDHHNDNHLNNDHHNDNHHDDHHQHHDTHHNDNHHNDNHHNDEHHNDHDNDLDDY